MNVARSIKKGLVDRGMSQTELAAKVGSKPAYISNLATGKATASEEMLKKISDALDMKVSEFVALGEE